MNRNSGALSLDNRQMRELRNEVDALFCDRTRTIKVDERVPEILLVIEPDTGGRVAGFTRIRAFDLRKDKMIEAIKAWLYLARTLDYDKWYTEPRNDEQIARNQMNSQSIVTRARGKKMLEKMGVAI